MSQDGQRRWPTGLVSDRQMARGLGLWLVVLGFFGLAAAAGAAQFVYVTNVASGNVRGGVSQYAVGAGGALSPLVPAGVTVGVEPFFVAVTPDGKSAYVPDGGLNSGSISQYSINPMSGALSPKTPAAVVDSRGPWGITVAPNGRSAYATNINGLYPGSISQYSIDPVTGVLSPKSPPTVAAGSTLTNSDPFSVAVAPDGKSAYVATFFSGVLQYDIDPTTGNLSPKTPASVSAGITPEGVVVTPDGKSAYVSNVNSNTISQYSIDPVTGTLSPKSPAFVATGSAPTNGLVVTPNGRSVFVYNSGPSALGGRTVSQYDVDLASGTLSPKTPASVAAAPGSTASGLAVTSDGKSAYVVNDSVISQYNIDPLTGALSPKTPATVATGGDSDGIAIATVSPTKHSTATSVSCSPSTFAPGDGSVCRATVTDTAISGQTTPTGTVNFTNSGAGALWGSPCMLSGSGASASCVVAFSSLVPSGQTITASYGGDATHTGSSGVTLQAVAVPASTAGCLVLGHGRVTAANGDRASFRGLAVATPPRGAEFYRDNRPANALRLRSQTVDAVTCAANATRATVFGTATVNSADSVEYRIDVQLTAREWGKDTYRIRLSNGYDSGTEQIRHGDIDIHLGDSQQHHRDANAGHHKNGGQDGG